MSQVPNATLAVVPEEKVTRYLLDLRSAAGAPNARFFLGRGFSREHWQERAE